jgi:hypothetical protein
VRGWAATKGAARGAVRGSRRLGAWEAWGRRGLGRRAARTQRRRGASAWAARTMSRRGRGRLENVSQYPCSNAKISKYLNRSAQSGE